METFVTSRKNMGMRAYCTELAAISDLRILKSLKEAYAEEESI